MRWVFIQKNYPNKEFLHLHYLTLLMSSIFLLAIRNPCAFLGKQTPETKKDSTSSLTSRTLRIVRNKFHFLTPGTKD